MKRMSQKAVLIAVVSAGALVLAGCGAGDDPALQEPAGAGSEAASLNDADVTFLQGMIPHHEQATEMAELVEDRTERDELREFAAKIIADQSAEIDQMKSLLAAGGAEETASEGGMAGMPGHGESAMDPAEMAELEGLSGDEFDLMFLDMMTRHHETAIEMAQQVLDAGESPQVKDLANAIIEAQQGEIEQMASWQEEWSA